MMAQFDFEIITYNGKGLENEWKGKRIFDHMKKNALSYLLVMIKETHSTRAREQL